MQDDASELVGQSCGSTCAFSSIRVPITSRSVVPIVRRRVGPMQASTRLVFWTNPVDTSSCVFSRSQHKNPISLRPSCAFADLHMLPFTTTHGIVGIASILADSSVDHQRIQAEPPYKYTTISPCPLLSKPGRCHGTHLYSLLGVGVLWTCRIRRLARGFFKYGITAQYWAWIILLVYASADE